MTKDGTVKELISQLKNGKLLVDEINTAYLGITTEEIIRMALEKKGEHQDGDEETTPRKGV